MNQFFAYKAQVDQFWLNFLCNLNQLFSYKAQSDKEVAHVTIGNQAFCLALYLTGVHCRGELQHLGHVGVQKVKCRLIRTREICGVRLQDERNVNFN